MDLKQTLNKRSGLFFAFLFIAASLFADNVDEVTDWTEFAGGSPIYASEVNNNFDNLILAVNENDERIDALGPTLSELGLNKTNWDTAFGWGNHGTAGYLTDLAVGSLTLGYVPFWNGTVLNDSPIYLDGGNVGIGTTEVGAPLVLYTDSDDLTYAGAVITQAGIGDAALDFLIYGQQTWTIGIDNSDADKFKISWSSGGLGTNDHMTIDTGGNVGIGTTAPGTRVHVERSNTSDTIPTSGTGESAHTGLGMMGNSGSYGILMGTLAASGVSWIQSKRFFDTDGITPASGAIDLLINPLGGNLGIGLTNPSVALDVDGSIEYTGTISDVSDIRLKENMSSIACPLDKIAAIDGISFNMKGSDDTEYGVAAQQLAEIVPELVSVMDDEEGYFGVNYIGLIPILVEAIKEQNEIIDDLAARIESLEAQLE